MDTKDRFISEMKEKVAELKSKRDYSAVSDQKRHEFNQRIDDMENHIEEARRNSDESKWDEIQNGLKDKWSELERKLKDLVD